jgi:hypothetical protein
MEIAPNGEHHGRSTRLAATRSIAPGAAWRSRRSTR